MSERGDTSESRPRPRPRPAPDDESSGDADASTDTADGAGTATATATSDRSTKRRRAAGWLFQKDDGSAGEPGSNAAAETAPESSDDSSRDHSDAAAHDRPRPSPEAAAGGADAESHEQADPSQKTEQVEKPGTDEPAKDAQEKEAQEKDAPTKPKKEKKEKKEKPKKERTPFRQRGSVRGAVRLVVIVVVVAIIAVLLRAFVVAPYYIPSASMEPTLQGGNGKSDDHILVDKISFRLHDPHESDIVVFNRPKTWRVPDTVLVKRVIGIPGDRVMLSKGLVYVNGLRVVENYVNPACGSRGTKPLTKTTKWTVPDDDYFVMGDNRCNSEDSRLFGYVPKSDMIGRAALIFFPFGRFGTP